MCTLRAVHALRAPRGGVHDEIFVFWAAATADVRVPAEPRAPAELELETFAIGEHEPHFPIELVADIGAHQRCQGGQALRTGEHGLELVARERPEDDSKLVL